MKSAHLQRALQCAVDASHAAGGLIRANHRSPKKINQATRHDIKLELDVRCQERIERILLAAFPDIPILGEEGVVGQPDAPYRWVVDPIDGTVNFTHDIPHCCTAIALQKKTDPPNAGPNTAAKAPSPSTAPFQTLAGVVYDPFCDELWTALQGKAARLNGRVIRASNRAQLAQCLVGVGFAKERTTLRRMVPVWNDLLRKVRKIRIMGAAALGLAYVASGRLDAYLEYGLRIWDVAAAGLFVECAGGVFWAKPLPRRRPDAYHIIASNQPLHRKLTRYR